MTILLILLLVAVVIVYVKRHAFPAYATPLIGVLIAAIFIVSGARLFCSRGGTGSLSDVISVSDTFKQAVGYRLGKAVAEDVPAGSAILLVHARIVGEGERRSLEGVAAAVREGLGGSYELHLVDATLRRGPMEDEVEPIVDHALRESVLRAHLAQYPDVKAVISFVGIPYFRTLPAPGQIPPLYVSGQVDEAQLAPLIQRGVVRAYALYRVTDVDWDAQPKRGMTHDEVFNLRFELRRSPAR